MNNSWASPPPKKNTDDLRRILFVGHSTHRSGAPLFLLFFLKWLRANHPHLSFDLLLKSGGGLDTDYQAVVSPMYWSLEGNAAVSLLDRHKLWGKRRRRLLNEGPVVRLHRERVLKRIRLGAYDLVFVNSFASSSIVPSIAATVSSPIVCRAPELQTVVNDLCNEADVASAIPHIDSFISVSNAVTDYMINDLGIEATQIVEISGFVRPVKCHTIDRTEFRRMHGIPFNSFVVCGCGTISWRKGCDLFVQAAIQLCRAHPDNAVHFIWVGGKEDGTLFHQIDNDVKNAGLSDRIHWLGESSSPQDAYSASDVFALTSREDPFPLVAIEAATAGLPIICFEGPIGTVQLVRRGAGIAVPYLSVFDFSKALSTLLSEPELRDLHATRARELSSEYTQDVICNKLLDHLRTVSEDYHSHRKTTGQLFLRTE